MTTDQEESDLDHDEVIRALAASREAGIRTTHAVARSREAVDGIRVIVERNGYVERFRGILRGS